jgi:hypothetical protein
MSRNGNGVYNLPAGNPVSSGSVISSAWANSSLSDIAAALTGSIASDGQTPVTGNLNMAGNKVSNLGAGTLATDAANLAQVTTATAITGGNINGTPIGQTTAAAGSFTTLSASGNLTAASNVTFSSTGSMKVPTGTLAQRNNNALGLIRFNTTYGYFEGCVAVVAGAAISTITRVSTLATLTTSTNHGLATGAYITVSGAIPVEFNGTYEITVTGVNTFTYVMATAPSADATVVGSYVVGTWSEISKSASSAGQCKLSLSGANLLLSPYGGNFLTINGVNCTIPAAGVTLSPTGLTPSTLYYIYAVATNGVVTSLEASGTGHSTSTTTGNIGVEIKTGDNTRSLVGMVYPISGPAFVDSSTSRLVLSWFNRVPKQSFTSVGATRTTTSASLVELSASDRAFFLSWASNAVQAFANISSNNTSSGDTKQIAISVDGTANSLQIWDGGSSLNTAANTTVYNGTLSEGFHYVSNMAAITNGQTFTEVAGGYSSISALTQG